MTVPKAAIYKKCRLPFGKDEIGLTGQITLEKSKSQSASMRDSPDDEFWQRILAPR
jgi:hypothetical protein